MIYNVPEMLEEEEEEKNKFESFAKQLQRIQESQDAILADIRMDMEQLQMDNLALRQSNARLLAEKNHWEQLYNEMCRNAKLMREHIQNCNYELPSDWPLSKSSSKSLHTPRSPHHHYLPHNTAPPRRKEIDCMSSSPSIHGRQKYQEKLPEMENPVRRRSRGRISASSQASLGESTASEDTQCDGNAYHSSRPKSPSRKTIIVPLKQKKKHGCFDFLRWNKSHKRRDELE